MGASPRDSARAPSDLCPQGFFVRDGFAREFLIYGLKLRERSLLECLKVL
jgi:hypothetical protein